MLRGSASCAPMAGRSTQPRWSCSWEAAIHRTSPPHTRSGPCTGNAQTVCSCSSAPTWTNCDRRRRMPMSSLAAWSRMRSYAYSFRSVRWPSTRCVLDREPISRCSTTSPQEYRPCRRKSVLEGSTAVHDREVLIAESRPAFVDAIVGLDYRRSTSRRYGPRCSNGRANASTGRYLASGSLTHVEATVLAHLARTD